MKEIIRIENIYKSFDQEKVLNGISFICQTGQITSIIGSSGSGKSTLLRCLNLLEIPDKGDIYFHNSKVNIIKNKAGQNVVQDEKELQLLRSKVAMVFQQFNLWTHKTVLENVTQAPILVLKKNKKQAEEEAEHYLNKVGLKQYSHKYPLQLSGGQKQRVGIARALAMEPELLLFDEPTSALDPEMVVEVLYIMEALAKEGRTMIMVSHEIEFVSRISNNILFLKNGRIEEQGSDILKHSQSDDLKKFLSHSIK